MKRGSILLCLFLLSSVLFAQKKNVILEQCDELTFDKKPGRSYQVLRGNVRFRHEDVLMYCDSAYFYDGENSFDAFGHVRVLQNADMSMFSDSMFYDGNTTLMRVRSNVVLNSGTSNLRTQFLDFNRTNNVGYYFGGGEVIDESYHLTSRQGFYYPDTKSYLFKDSVLLTHPDYVIHADSLRYNQNSGRAVLIGPSRIIGRTYRVYTRNGWTNTKTNVGKLYDYSVITYANGKRLTADSIYFDSEKSRARAFHQVEVQDSLQKMIMRGDYLEFDRAFPSYIKLLENPYVVNYSDADSLYLGADTIYYCQIDSVKEELRAYHGVKFFRNDLQGMCDSMVYFIQDSMSIMYNTPFIWSEGNQLTGDGTIEIYMKNRKPEHIHIPYKAFIASDEGYDQYNQLSSREANAYIVANKLERVDLIGDAISLYYSKDEEDALVGMNSAKGEEMSIFTQNNKLEKIIMTPDSEGVMYPPNKIPEDERFLKSFVWKYDERPKSREEVIYRK